MANAPPLNTPLITGSNFGPVKSGLKITNNGHTAAIFLRKAQNAKLLVIIAIVIPFVHSLFGDYRTCNIMISSHENTTRWHKHGIGTSIAAQ